MKKPVSNLDLGDDTSYSGDAIKGVPNGYGEIRSNRDGKIIFKGRFKDGKKHGKGITINPYLAPKEIQSEGYYKQGEMMTGTIYNPYKIVSGFKDGKPHGKNVKVYNPCEGKGVIFQGEMKDGDYYNGTVDLGVSCVCKYENGVCNSVTVDGEELLTMP